MPVFVPGRDLSADYYREVIAPVITGIPHAAALLGWGSDVLGYDTERSTDHGRGRVEVSTLREWLLQRFDFVPGRSVSTRDWLLTPQ